MKALFLSILLCSCFVVFSQTPCVNGSAAIFPCNGFNLQDRVTLLQMNASSANDSWGWTDPNNGNEYALIGLDRGTAFINISNPTNVVYLGVLPTHTENSPWRDIKVYNNYAFIVSEASNHGMQVFDLTRLRNVTSPQLWTEDAHYNQFGNAHNIVINEDFGFAYAVGTSTFNGGPHFIDISNPINPIPAGGYAMNDYTHDGQIVTYNGPDLDYSGREIFIGSNLDKIVIVDITDKDNPQFISELTYPNIRTTHQGWFTEDQRFFILGDEGDELTFGFNTRTLIFDFEDLDDPVFYFDYFGNTASVDHNGYVNNGLFYLASYSAGMRVFDLSAIQSKTITEIGFFDTIPDNNDASFQGTWNVYPFFESGNIVLSGSAGFTLVRGDAVLAINDTLVEDFSIYPNPASNQLTIISPLEEITQIEIYNLLGQKVAAYTPLESLSETINISSLNAGVYLLKINATITKKVLIK